MIQIVDRVAYSRPKRFDPRKEWELYDDFISNMASVNSGKLGWRRVVSGAGADIVGSAAGSGRPGLARLATGTDTNGRASIDLGINVIPPQLGKTFWEANLELSALSDGTNTYKAIVGLVNDQTGAVTDGVYFEYDSTASANWRAVTEKDNSPTVITSSIPVVAALQRLRFETNDDWTQVAFYIGDVLVGVQTLTIPVAADTIGPVFSIIKSAGGTSRELRPDLFWMGGELAVPR